MTVFESLFSKHDNFLTNNVSKELLSFWTQKYIQKNYPSHPAKIINLQFLRFFFKMKDFDAEMLYIMPILKKNQYQNII